MEVTMENVSDRMYKIRTLGGFSIESDGHILTDSVCRMHQVWNFIYYLIANRGKTISQAALIDALWPDGRSDDPANALKNLAYRARTLLSNQLPQENRPFIVFRLNAYMWNDQLDCVSDIELVEKAWESAKATDDPAVKLEAYLAIITLYCGTFLAKDTFNEWIISPRMYYSAIFCNSVERAFHILIENDSNQAVQICEKAASLEKYSERMHELLIRAYIASGDFDAALKQYYYTTEMFYKELGIKVSDRITVLYREITKSVFNAQADLHIIEKQLAESAGVSGAYYCDYEIFCNVYRVQSRYILRSGQSFVVALITLSAQGGKCPQDKSLISAMELLKETIVGSLRKCDLVSRFSPNQYVLLLGSISYECGQMVLERIQKKLVARMKSNHLETHCNVMPVNPAQECTS